MRENRRAVGRRGWICRGVWRFGGTKVEVVVLIREVIEVCLEVVEEGRGGDSDPQACELTEV